MPPPTNSTDARLTALETKVTALQADMLSVKTRLTSAESSIANLAANKADTTAMIAAIKTATNSLQSAIDGLTASKADASSVAVLAASIQSLQDDVSKLEAQVAYLIGVYPPNPNPPQQVAQDITPDFVTFSDQQSGYIFTVVATGGIPDDYTYALTGPDAGLFSIDSVSGDVSAPSPITAGSYDISAEVTNAKGTATFPIGVTTTSDVYATPSESTLPSQVLYLDARVGGLWHAAAGTNVPGISVGQSLGAEPYNVQLALAGKGPTVVRVPAGNFSISRGAGLAGKTYWIGTKDGNGQPTTVFTGVGSVVTFGWATTDPNADCWIKDILIGPTDQQLIDNGITYQQGGRAVQGSGAGRLSLINVVIRNIAEVGLYCNDAQFWLTRRSFQCWVYDSEIYGCGTNAQEHNIYWHAGTLAFIRSISRDTRGSHALKAENEKLIVLDSRLVRDTGIGLKGPGNHSAALNMSPACDIRVARNFLQHVDPSSNNISIVETISRGDAGGGLSLKTPPSEDVENDPGVIKTPDGILGHWASLGFAPGVSKNIEAAVATAAAAGSPSVNIKLICSEGYKSGRNLSLATSYTVRFLRSDGARQEITATPTVVGAGTATIPVVGGVGAPGIAVNSPVSIKIATDTWDYRRVNERFWHKGSVGYWWDAIRSGANLDLTKQDLFNTMYMQDNLYLIQTPANNTQLLQQSTDAPFEYRAAQEGFRANIPFAPINRPGGAGGGWADVPGYGSWAEPLAGDGYPYYGRNGNVSDFVFRFPIFWADNGVAKLQGGTGEQFDQIVTGGTYDALGDIRWLDSGGALNKVISTDANRNPLPAFVTTTLSAQGNSGSHTATVASIAGLVSGQKFIVDMQAPRGSNRTIHITTINGTPSGNTVTMTDAWPMNVPSGSAVSAFTKAGAKPATWINPVDYASQ